MLVNLKFQLNNYKKRKDFWKMPLVKDHNF